MSTSSAEHGSNNTAGSAASTDEHRPTSQSGFQPATKLAESQPPESGYRAERRQPGPSESGEFPRAVDWANPRVAAILETAAACFSRGGFTATTLADIGRELGLRKSIVHYYFASKAALVHEVQSFAYGRYMNLLKQENDASSGAKDQGLTAIWDQLAEDASVRGLNIELWSEGRRDAELASRAGNLQDEARHVLADRLQDSGQAKEDSAEDLATLTLAVLDGLTVLAEREGSTERSTRAFAQFTKLLDHAKR